MTKNQILGLFLIFWIFCTCSCLAADNAPTPRSAKGLVLEVQNTTKAAEKTDFIWQGGDQNYVEQALKVKILSGADQGKVVEILNHSTASPLDILVAKGDKVFLYIENFGPQQKYFIRDFWHLDNLIFWLIVFLALVILLGKSQGCKALLALALSLLLIFGIFIPLVVQGASPLPLAVLIAFAVSCLTLPIIYGFSWQALIAILGTLGGILTAVIFALFINHFAHLTGLGAEDVRIFAVQNPNFNFQGLLLAGIILGALGAIMDVAVSIAAGLQEIKAHKPQISFKELVASGLKIGRAILGSMLNTLVFAYVGASLIIILLVIQNQIGLLEFLNYGFVVEEIVRTLIGSIGLLATIPLTALAAGFFYQHRASSNAANYSQN